MSREDRRKFLKICPEFVIEVMSPSDRLTAAKNKTVEWRKNGVDLGWLIDGDNRTVYIYRARQAASEKVTNAQSIAGKGLVAGFALDLVDIWAGLDD